MFRDLLQGSPIEADQIIGDLLARCAKAGIPTPLPAFEAAFLRYPAQFCAIKAKSLADPVQLVPQARQKDTCLPGLVD
jgi:hypothetical protein